MARDPGRPGPTGLCTHRPGGSDLGQARAGRPQQMFRKTLSNSWAPLQPDTEAVGRASSLVWLCTRAQRPHNPQGSSARSATPEAPQLSPLLLVFRGRRRGTKEQRHAATGSMQIQLPVGVSQKVIFGEKELWDE